MRRYKSRKFVCAKINKADSFLYKKKRNWKVSVSPVACFVEFYPHAVTLGHVRHKRLFLHVLVVVITADRQAGGADLRSRQIQHIEHLEHIEHIEHIEHLEHIEQIDYIEQLVTADRQTDRSEESTDRTHRT